MKIAISAFLERLRGSLFVVPMGFVVAGIVLGQVGLALDDAIGSGSSRLPLGFTSTVQSARAVLSTVAGATITVAGIAFSVSLLTIQLASSQYSPRVVSGLFRDPFNKRVIGLVVGTFTFCLVVLRSVRAPLEAQGSPVIPNVSVAVGVILGIGSILAIVAFMNHNAHTMDISEILDGVTRDTTGAIERHWSHHFFEPSDPVQPDVLPTGPSCTVRVDRDGWVQLLDHEKLLRTLPEGGTVRLDVAVGEYLVRGSRLCTVWPEPEDVDTAVVRCRESVHLGANRTMQQDAEYGLRQLVDVGLKALSPGVNDPTTAQDAIVHIGSVVRAFLDRDPPASDMHCDGRRFVLAHAGGPDHLVALAYDELRLAAADHPAVCVYLLDSIGRVYDSLRPDRRECVHDPLRRHSTMILAAAERAAATSADASPVREAFERLPFARV